MTHRSKLAVLGLVLGCVPARVPESAPPPRDEPTPPPASAAAEPAREDRPVAETPWTDAERAILDSALARRLAADSASDAAVLEQLHADTLAAGAELDVSPAFDINVARYADHPRVLHFLEFFQGPARPRMNVWLERLPRYEPMIRTELASRNLPGDLVYLGLIESGYSNTAVSRSRAVGMWQFMRGTGRQYGLRIDKWVDERRDPIRATRAAAQHLADLTSRLGSHYLAAAAYNAGMGRVLRGLNRMGDAPGPAPSEDEDDAVGSDEEEPVADDQFFRLSDTRYLRRETRDYVPKLIAATMIAKQPEKYGFPPIPDVPPYAVDSVPVTEATSLETVARASGAPAEEIIALNAHFVRRITPPVPVAWVRVPPGRGVATTEALAALPDSERIAPVTHVVRRGETVRSIAPKYGLTASELAAFNPDVPTSRLKAGVTLRVPGHARVKGLLARDASEAAGGVRVGSAGTHLVRRGETLGEIARAYRVSVGHLRAWNGLGGSSLIRAGQRLRVRPPTGSASRAVASQAPAPDGSTHLVRRGETLSGLARRYGVSVADLMAANGLESSRSLRAGARLRIPAPS
jgi:membrane-bound lytic murein transglycosylase D